MKIKFLGYFDGDELDQVYSKRANPMELEQFYNAINTNVNQGGCSCCCKKDAKLYAIYAEELPIRPHMISLCENCIRSLSAELEIINISANGVPPTCRLNVD